MRVQEGEMRGGKVGMKRQWSRGLCNLVKVMRQRSLVTRLGCECCLCAEVDTREREERIRADPHSGLPPL